MFISENLVTVSKALRIFLQIERSNKTKNKTKNSNIPTTNKS